MRENGNKSVVLNFVLAIGVSIFALILIVTQPLSSKKNNSVAESKTVEASKVNSVVKTNVAFDKGIVKENVFINKWSNLRFGFNNGWKDGNEQQYENYASEGVCDLFAYNEEDDAVVRVIYTNLKSIQAENEEDSMNLARTLSDGMACTMPNSKVTIKGSLVIGGNNYSAVEIQSDINGQKTEIINCVEIRGNQRVLISVQSNKEGKAMEALKHFNEATGIK